MDGRGSCAATVLFATLLALFSAAPAHAQLSLAAPVQSAGRWAPDATMRGGGALEVAPDTAQSQVVAVWNEERPNVGVRVRGARLDADGRAVGTVKLYEGIPSPADDPDVAYDSAGGRGLLVAHVGRVIWGQRLNADMTPSGSAFVIATPAGTTEFTEPRAVWDSGGGAWIVAYRSKDSHASPPFETLRTRTVSTTGAVGGENEIDRASYLPYGVALAAGANGDVLALWSRTPTSYWHNRHAVTVRRLTDTGAATGDPVRLTTDAGVDSTGFGAATPDAVWDGTRWHVAWSEGNTETWRTETRTVRLSSALVPQGTPVVVGSQRNPPYDNAQVRLAALPSRDEVLVTWWSTSPQTTEGRMIRASTGAVLDDRSGSLWEFKQPETWFVPFANAVAPIASRGTFLALYDMVDYYYSDPARTAPGGIWARHVSFGRAPETNLLTAPSNGHARPTGTATFSASSAATFQCTLRDIPELNLPVWEPCTSPWSFSLERFKEYEVYVRASAGGWSDGTPGRKVFMTDEFDAPVVTFDWTPPRMTTSRKALFEFHADEPDARFTCSLDGLPAFDCSSRVVEYVDLPLGNHAFAVAATDPQGRTGDPTVFTWTVFTLEESGQRSGTPPPPPPAPVTPAWPGGAPGVTTLVPQPSRSARARAPRRCLVTRHGRRARPTASARKCVPKRVARKVVRRASKRAVVKRGRAR